MKGAANMKAKKWKKMRRREKQELLEKEKKVQLRPGRKCLQAETPRPKAENEAENIL